MEINLKDIHLSPDLDSVFCSKITDKEYFSNKYRDYISNSRLKLINLEQGGSPSLYKKGLIEETNQSLTLGSSVHELFLQEENFYLGPKTNKPTAKLGLVLDTIISLRNSGSTIYHSIIEACQRIHYYENTINPIRITAIIKQGLDYYFQYKKIYKEGIILLSNKDRDTVDNCVSNLRNNRYITNIVFPNNYINTTIKYFNEEAFFININATYKDKSCTLKLKMKVDNWTIDIANKIITLNDLKTTSHNINTFMENSFVKFHYTRQFSMYLWILLRYCEKVYGYNSKEWTVKCNVIVVETTGNNRVTIYSISKSFLEEGRKEFCRLLKSVAYCEMEDYVDTNIFI